MVRKAYVEAKEIEDFINSVGEEKIITIIPLEYGYNFDTLSSRYHPKESATGYAIVTKYLIIYSR